MSGEVSLAGPVAGHYRQKGDRRGAYVVVGEGRISWREGGREERQYGLEIQYGDLRPAERVLADLTQTRNYNFRWRIVTGGDRRKCHDMLGIVRDGGENIYFLNNVGDGVDQLCRITEEEARELGECREKACL